jgi:hypothetical protein
MPFQRPARRADDPQQVLMRLYVSGRSEYTRAVLQNLDTITRRYDPAELTVQVRDAKDAEEDERVFFTPMLIVQDARDPDRKTVVVGDLRKPDVLSSALASHGIAPHQ